MGDAYRRLLASLRTRVAVRRPKRPDLLVVVGVVGNPSATHPPMACGE